jgi:uncharacterized damage-inducible protein DinB
VLIKKIKITMETNLATPTSNSIISPAQLLEHWQGHRSLTRRVIETYPAGKLFNYSIGGMRTFAQLISEMTDLAAGGIEGIATGQWKPVEELGHITGNAPDTKEGILTLWDKITVQINLLWKHIPISRFQEVEMAFGAYEGTVYSTLLYIIDNETHHRGQAYVYLRSLGITPPPFWDRA